MKFISGKENVNNNHIFIKNMKKLKISLLRFDDVYQEKKRIPLRDKIYVSNLYVYTRNYFLYYKIR